METALLCAPVAEILDTTTLPTEETATPAPVNTTPVLVAGLDLTVVDEDDEADLWKDPFAEPDATLTAYIKALEEQAKGYIGQFFANKKFHCGGPIPKNYLYSEQSINLVLSTEFCKGVDLCYEALTTVRAPKNHDEEETVPWDIYMVLNLIAEVRAMQIPKDFQAGIMLLYLKLCKGARMPEKNEVDITHITELVELDD